MIPWYALFGQQREKGAYSMNTPLTPLSSNLTTNHMLGELLAAYVTKIGKKCNAQPLLVLKAWPEVIGQFAHMTRATRFEDGVLHVSVSNSTLLSLLSNPKDKARLMQALMQRVPGIELKSIVFRNG